MDNTTHDRGLMADAIREILDEANACKAERRDSFQAGRLLAYNEVLTILKTTVNGDPELEKLLNFDIDAEYV